VLRGFCLLHCSTKVESHAAYVGTDCQMQMRLRKLAHTQAILSHSSYTLAAMTMRQEQSS
jgi:hypothetical protein